MMKAGLVLLLATAFASNGARAARPARDKRPPRIEHVAPSSAPAGEPLRVEAVITDESGVFDPVVLWRPASGDEAGPGAGREYARAEMREVEGAADTYAALLPIEGEGAIEYLIEAFDVEGNGPARAGAPDAPLVVALEAAAAQPEEAPAPAPAAPAPAAAAPAPASEDDGGAGLWLGLGAASAAAVVLVAGAAVAGFYALRPPTPTSVRLVVSAPAPISTEGP